MKIIGNPGLIFLTVGIAVLGIVLFLPPIRQDPSYHSFADQREFWAIPNFWNVVSNLPFLIVGLVGSWFVAKAGNNPSFLAPEERWPSSVLFVGVVLTALG